MFAEQVTTFDLEAVRMLAFPKMTLQLEEFSVKFSIALLADEESTKGALAFGSPSLR